MHRYIERIKRKPDGEMTARDFLKEMFVFLDSAHININSIFYSLSNIKLHYSTISFFQKNVFSLSGQKVID